MEIHKTVVTILHIGKQLAILPVFPYNGLISIGIAKVTHVEYKVIFVHLVDQVFSGVQ